MIFLFEIYLEGN